MRELELLAPARTADIGIAAIDCGADAVYIAGPAFGARQAAGNEISEIGRLCRYAHKFGARIFATLNTIIFDHELEQAYGMMEELQDAGADAIIIQDLALSPAGLELAGRCSNLGIPLHASTQCAIRTPEKAAMLEKLGFSRLILERELSLEQIKAIRKATGCELEFFVHGALCVCYSGQCYISENISGRSANRGACIQACRSLYNLVDGDGKKLVANKPLLSLKDYNLKERLEDLAEAGISSFKIEGRLKNISYVKNIVRDYSQALDRLTEKYPDRYRRASFGKVSGGFTPDPGKTFNRGYTSLFLDGRRGQWASRDAAKSMGEPVGTVKRLSADKTSFNICPAAPDIIFGNGDGFCFITDRNEVIGFRADVCSGTGIKCRPVPELAEGTMLFRNIDTAFEKQLETGTPSRTVNVTLRITVSGGDDSPVLEVSATSEDGRTCTVRTDSGAGPARNTEKMYGTLAAQLSKTSGHYAFSVTPFHADTLPFLPVSAVNAVRRDIAGILDSMPVLSRPLSLNHPDRKIFTERPMKGSVLTYKDNIANHAAAELAAALGAESAEPAYELRQKPEAELMRTRYCIRYQYGRCPVHHGRTWPGSLFLENNGRLFPLGFDCGNCEMTVSPPLPRK